MATTDADTKRSQAMRDDRREPALDDMLTDPVTRAVMASDGVAAEDVKDLLAAAWRRYGGAGAGTASRRRG
jgi:hypothetical protein